jgi:hypothetical protein
LYINIENGHSSGKDMDMDTDAGTDTDTETDKDKDMEWTWTWTRTRIDTGQFRAKKVLAPSKNPLKCPIICFVREKKIISWTFKSSSTLT